jgi:hypothetical protein
MTTITRDLTLFNSMNDKITIQYKINILADGTPKILGSDDLKKKILDAITQANEKPGANIFHLPSDTNDILLTYIKKRLDDPLKTYDTIKKQIHNDIYDGLKINYFIPSSPLSQKTTLFDRSIEMAIKNYVTQMRLILNDSMFDASSEIYQGFKDTINKLLNTYISQNEDYFVIPLFTGIVEFTGNNKFKRGVGYFKFKNYELGEIFQKNIIDDNIQNIFIDNLENSLRYMYNNNIILSNYGLTINPRILMYDFIKNITDQNTILIDDYDGNAIITINNIPYNQFLQLPYTSDTTSHSDTSSYFDATSHSDATSYSDTSEDSRSTLGGGYFYKYFKYYTKINNL